MSLREREVLIEYIRTVRDNQALIERMAQYINNANNRVTTAVLVYINGLETNSHSAVPATITSDEIASSRSEAVSNRSEAVSNRSEAVRNRSEAVRNRSEAVSNRSEAVSNRSEAVSSEDISTRLSLLLSPQQQPVTIPRERSPPPLLPLPPPPPMPPLVHPPPTIPALISPRLSSVRTSSVPTISPRRRRRRATSIYHSSESDNLITSSNASDAPTLSRIRSRINSTPNRVVAQSSSGTIPPLDLPPGLGGASQNFVVSSRHRIPVRRAIPPIRRPNLIDIPNSMDDIPSDLDSPVRIRPSISQIRGGTELLKWEEIVDSYQDTCPIDFNTFAEGDDILRIKSCRHIFREMNLRQWFRHSPRCPICRYDIRDYVSETQ